MSRTLYVTDHRLTTRQANNMLPRAVGTHHNIPDWPPQRIIQVYGIAQHLKAELQTYEDGKPVNTVIQEGSSR
jgi:hypothetical protein